MIGKIVTFCTSPKEFDISCINQLSIYLLRTLVTLLPPTEIYNQNKKKLVSHLFDRAITNASKKDGKTYSRFRKCLITEMAETAALIACGIGKGKATAEGFQRNALYIIFLRCFIHYKRNIWRNASLVQKVSSFFRKTNSGRRKTR